MSTFVTRIPETMHYYLKPLAFYKYKMMNRMYETAVIHFLKEKPYEQGMHFRKSKASGDGFEQINLALSDEVGRLVQREADRQNVSKAAFLYTALFWWAWYIWPPKTKISKPWDKFYTEYPEEFLAEVKREAGL